ncbi:MAG: hypothetical protein WAT72_01000 [Microgenomates group bacterium]|jgi:hypothetical protein|nr:hypothetical protein [Candidatus Woesebacteria bacterium]MBP6882903.1 hypothetical protein [Candidatus Woesebacteria bacterium]QQR63475.1 MAG: hypothetical protein IPH70_03105 [Candidatus Roizmanbacteria bacterium]
MSTSNFTPISGNKSKKSKSSIFRVLSLITLFVTLVGVGVGYVMVQQGFNFRPKATSASRYLETYGWNGSCFTALSTIKYAARYQCPGKIENYASGCQDSTTGAWQYNSVLNPLTSNGQSNVCILPDGSNGPKDGNGCFTQQLDLQNGVPGSPQGFYSFDSCPPSNPKPPAVTTCDGGFYCDGRPVLNSTIGQVVCGNGDSNWTGYNWKCGTDGKWFPLHTQCNMCVVVPTATPFPTPTPGPNSTPTPSPRPTITPTPISPTPTPKPPTPTPTIPACIQPSSPANVRINCPLCSQVSPAQ